MSSLDRDDNLACTDFVDSRVFNSSTTDNENPSESNRMDKPYWLPIVESACGSIIVAKKEIG